MGLITVLTAVPAGGNWGTAATWSPAQVPTAADDCVLASTSGNVTADTTTRFCRSLDCTGYTGTLTLTTSLSVGTSTAGTGNNALKFVAGMTVTGSGTITFLSTSGTQQTIDLAGKSVFNFSFTGAGSSYLLTGTLLCGNSIGFTAGTLNTNGQSVTAASISVSGATTRTLTLGASAISLSASSAWSVSGSNVTINAGTSTITLTAAAPIFTGGGQTYYNLTCSASVNSIVQLLGANTFNNVTLPTATGVGQNLQLGANTTINGTLTMAGTSVVTRPLVSTNVVGTQFTLTLATASLAYVDFQDINGAGAFGWNLSAITGLSGDCGNNSGITFTTSISQTLSLTAANATWASYGWATRVPLPQDDVTVTNAATATRSLAFTSSVRTVHNIDFSGMTSTFSTTTSNVPTVLGNFTGISTLIIGSGVTFGGRGTQLVDWNSTVCNATLTVNVGGTNVLRLSSNTTVNNSVTLTTGTLDLNGCTLQMTSFGSNNSLVRSVAFGGGTINLTTTAASTIWTATSTNFTTSGSGVIAITTTSANTRVFAGASCSYPELRYSVAGSTGTLQITGSNTFSGITFSDATSARTLQFTAATTTTISDATKWHVLGTSGIPMTVNSVTAATHTLSCTSGSITSDYLTLSNSHAGGGATWYAGSHSTDSGNNTGWSFTDPPLAPDAPTINSATVSSGQASIAFTPAGTGGTPTGYTVTVVENSTTFTGASSPIVATGLTNGTSYTFTVHATNGLGSSAESSAYGPVLIGTTPGAPTNIVATAGDRQATITFDAPGSDGGGSITSYTVTSNPGLLTASGSSPLTVTGLTAGTSYTFTVHATNSFGDGTESSASNAVIPFNVTQLAGSLTTLGIG